MSKRANYSMINIMDMIQFACNEGVYPSYQAIRNRHPGFGAHHGTFMRVRAHMVLKGLKLPDNPREYHTMHAGFMEPIDPRWVNAPDELVRPRVKKAPRVRSVRLVTPGPVPGRPKPKKPWRPIYARNWSEAQMIRLKATLDAVHDFRAAWKRLHVPPKEQRVTGINRCHGSGQPIHMMVQPRCKTRSRFLNPVEASPLNGDAPPWHPMGDGI